MDHMRFQFSQAQPKRKRDPETISSESDDTAQESPEPTSNPIKIIEESNDFEQASSVGEAGTSDISGPRKEKHHAKRPRLHGAPEINGTTEDDCCSPLPETKSSSQYAVSDTQEESGLGDTTDNTCHRPWDKFRSLSHYLVRVVKSQDQTIARLTKHITSINKFMLTGPSSVRQVEQDAAKVFRSQAASNAIKLGETANQTLTDFEQQFSGSCQRAQETILAELEEDVSLVQETLEKMYRLSSDAVRNILTHLEWDDPQRAVNEAQQMLFREYMSLHMKLKNRRNDIKAKLYHGNEDGEAKAPDREPNQSEKDGSAPSVVANVAPQRQGSASNAEE
ncbi:MAG: hypothetical protein Q9222_002969 [Ikaeria aurantiellina]